MSKAMRMAVMSDSDVYRCPKCDFFRVRTGNLDIIRHGVYGSIMQADAEELDIRRHECEPYMRLLEFVRCHIAPLQPR